MPIRKRKKYKMNILKKEGIVNYAWFDAIDSGVANMEMFSRKKFGQIIMNKLSKYLKWQQDNYDLFDEVNGENKSWRDLNTDFFQVDERDFYLSINKLLDLNFIEIEEVK